MKIRSKCVWGWGVWGRGCVSVRRGRWECAPPASAYMSMATTTLVRAAMTHAVTNM